MSGPWFGSVLNPKPLGHGPRPLYCVDGNGGAGWEDVATSEVVGFMCVADAHTSGDDAGSCPGLDHGGWTDTAEMMRACAAAMESPGCDIRLILESIPGHGHGSVGPEDGTAICHAEPGAGCGGA